MIRMKLSQCHSSVEVRSAGLPTATLALALGIRDHSIRKRYCETGSYFGVKPVKLPNGKLRWPDDSVERLVGSAHHVDGSIE
jgi:predicted site-specific integrase-resolvase